MSPRFVVCSEEYGTVVPILDYGQGPMEYGCDVWEGEAKNKTEARRKAYEHWRDTHTGPLERNRSDDRHPMAGVKVEGPLEPCEKCGKFDDCECLGESSE